MSSSAGKCIPTSWSRALLGMPQFGSELWFEPEPSRTGPKFGPGFRVGAELDQWSHPGFGGGPNLAGPFRTGSEPRTGQNPAVPDEPSLFSFFFQPPPLSVSPPFFVFVLFCFRALALAATRPHPRLTLKNLLCLATFATPPPPSPPLPVSMPPTSPQHHCCRRHLFDTRPFSPFRLHSHLCPASMFTTLHLT